MDFDPYESHWRENVPPSTTGVAKAESSILLRDLTRPPAAKRLGLSAAAREQDDRAFLHLAKNELGLDDHDIIRLHGLVVGALTQVTPEPQEPGELAESHTAKLHERNVEIRRVLRAQLGEAEASDVMRRTEALIAKHPELQQLVNGDELATHAEPFLLLAQHVRDRHIR